MSDQVIILLIQSTTEPHMTTVKYRTSVHPYRHGVSGSFTGMGDALDHAQALADGADLLGEAVICVHESISYKATGLKLGELPLYLNEMMTAPFEEAWQELNK